MSSPIQNPLAAEAGRNVDPRDVIIQCAGDSWTIEVTVKNLAATCPKGLVKVRLAGKTSQSPTRTDKKKMKVNQAVYVFTGRGPVSYEVTALFASELYAVGVKNVQAGPGWPNFQKVTLEITDLVRSAPVIKIPAPGILIVRHAYHGQPQPGVPPHRIPVRLSASPPFDGTGELEYPAYLRAFDSRNDTVPLPSPLPLSTADLQGRTIYLEASQPSPSNLGTLLRLALRGGSVPPFPPVSVPFTCVRLKLDVFEQAANEPLSEAAKLTPGRAVVVNNKRAKLVLSQAAPTDFPGTILIRPLAANLSAHSTEEPAPGDVALLPAGLSFPNPTLAAPRTLWTGATAVSQAIADAGWFAGVQGVEESASLVEGDRVAHTAITLTLEMFTGPFAAGTPIQIAPFYPNDDAASLDAPLPDAEHNQPVPARPPRHDAAFAAPVADFYGDHVAANGDPKVFRFRVRVAPSVAAIAADTINLKVKVLTAAGGPPTLATSVAFAAPNGTASHAEGLPLKLQRQPAANLFLSPYLRVLTMAQTGRSRVANYAIIHSLPPIGSATIAQGFQFGRQLVVTAASPPLAGNYTLGGLPYANIPVQFYYVNNVPPDPKFATIVNGKVHQLNQYWAAAGLQFDFADPNSRLAHKAPPTRSLLTIGEDTGCAIVSPMAFDLSVDLTVTTAGGATGTVTLDAQIPANSSSRAVADALLIYARQLLFAAPPLAGLRLDGDIFDLVNPRSTMAFDLGLCRDDIGPGYNMTQMPHRIQLPVVGTAGPVDLNFRVVPANAVTSISVTQILAFDAISGAPLALDLKAPVMTNADHGVARNPPDAVARHWVRQFAPGAPTSVSILFEGPNCYPADSGSRTLLNPGIWNEANARLICYMKDNQLVIGADDVQHELGHVLTFLNHTLFHPKWFYNAELLRNGSGEPQNKTTRITAKKIFVDGLEFFNGHWYAAYVALPNGYGGAARAGAVALNPAWAVAALAPGQLPW